MSVDIALSPEWQSPKFYGTPVVPTAVLVKILHMLRDKPCWTRPRHCELRCFTDSMKTILRRVPSNVAVSIKPRCLSDIRRKTGSLVTNRTRVYASTKTYFLRWKAFWQPSLQALSLADRDCAHYNCREGGGVKQKQRLRYRWGWGVEDGKERGMDKQQPPPRLCYNCVREGGREDR